MIRTILALALAMVFLGPAAQAQTGEAADLIARSQALDSLCRGSIGLDDMQRAGVCCGRTLIAARLNQLGWCYGVTVKVAADPKWHRCSRTSQRQNPRDSCAAD
jgi:hypothetical protein